MQDWLDMLWNSVAGVFSFALLTVDGTHLTIGRLVSALLLVGVSVYLSRRASTVLANRVLPKLRLSTGAIGALESISFYVFVVILTLVALRMAGVPYGAFAVLGGALAIGLGFGSQNVVNNFISGIIMLIEQPVKRGDLVDVEGTFGVIENIGPRSTQVRTPENTHVMFPNSFFLEREILNWTLADNTVRTSIKVGVAYGSDCAKVAELLGRAADQHADILKMPEPLILFTDFADSALTFELVFWVRMETMMDKRRLESDLRFSVDTLLRDGGITIAFPQRDVHLQVAKPIDVRVVNAAEPNGKMHQ